MFAIRVTHHGGPE
ncbi:MAG: hypothetical protein K0S92_777, partial [Desertimonas sp.]|nr:hypothetical protein [Desertimonas sp.]